LYATCIGFLGLNSIVTLSAIACERYIVITSSSCRPAVAKWRITRCQAQKVHKKMNCYYLYNEKPQSTLSPPPRWEGSILNLCVSIAKNCPGRISINTDGC
jgi:hypothetical protein